MRAAHPRPVSRTGETQRGRAPVLAMDDLPAIPPIGGLPGVQPWPRHPDSPLNRPPRARSQQRPGRSPEGGLAEDAPLSDPLPRGTPGTPGAHVDERAGAVGDRA